jgi:diaminopimelate epimerase
MKRAPSPLETPAGLVFHKMHGAGNDFVLLDLRDQSLAMDAALASRMANRHLGIGCDQILILRHATRDGAALRYEIRNADGSPAGQCGNGARCIALYLFMLGEAESGTLVLESPAGLVRIDRCPDGEFEVEMGEPAFEPERVPVALQPQHGGYQLDSPWGALRFGAASMGNPHALVEVDDIDEAAVATVGAFLSRHPAFGEGCNAGFAEVVDRGNIRLRVFERGAGETLACGSGACAAMAILRRKNRVDEVVDVTLPGGHLVIKWPGTGTRLKMKGPACHVFKGIVSHD